MRLWAVHYRRIEKLNATSSKALGPDFSGWPRLLAHRKHFSFNEYIVRNLNLKRVILDNNLIDLYNL